MENKKEFECVCCENVFASQAELDLHFRVLPKEVHDFYQKVECNPNESPFACSECLFVSDRKYNFQQHLENVHKMPKNQVVELCKKCPKDTKVECPHCHKDYIRRSISTHIMTCKHNVQQNN